MKSTLCLAAANVILGVNYVLICFVAVLVLSGCSSIGTIDVTCTYRDARLNCGVGSASSQDLRANQTVAKDEKPDWPFKESLQRSEETSS